MSKSKKLSGWGGYPVVTGEELTFHTCAALREQLISGNGDIIARGNGRSYGDSALSPTVAPMRRLNRILAFDEQTGLLTCEAGVLLSEIIEVFLPQGWFLKVTPGTKLITVGGAIASDVHGKNHHVEGCFSTCVHNFELLLADGRVVTCSASENRELFLASCGGMGLTGIILQASFYLKRVRSRFIEQTTIKTKNLLETFEAFERSADRPYSVAWIDCLNTGDAMGRSILMTGDFAGDGDLTYRSSQGPSIPFYFPGFVLNKMSVKAFNAVYYRKAKNGQASRRVSVDGFFYPLDAIGNWNRIYGKNGFTQYQFILPKAASYDGLTEILKFIAGAGSGSFLAVLKLYGNENDNYLSFPLEGYGLALDFKIEKKLFGLLDQLDKIVVDFGGRIFLTKDVRVSREVFERGYPRVKSFREVRRKYNLDTRFNSLQSRRLEL